MSVTYSSHIAKYSGIRYKFVASIVDLNENKLLDLSPLHTGIFEYENSLNCLCLKGSIEYTDVEGKLINKLGSQYLFALVCITELNQDTDKNFKDERESNTNKFKHNFIVNSIDIIERKDNIIKYKIGLLSKNYYNLASNVKYSNFNRQPQSILSIMNMCIMQNACQDYTTYISSFIDNDDIKINYATVANDNAFTSVKYLMSKMFYYRQKNNSIKVIKFDELKNQYSIVDIKKLDVTNDKCDQVILSMFKGNEEDMVYQHKSNLASVVEFPKEKLYQMLVDKNIYGYDHEKNNINMYVLSSLSIASYYNNHNNCGNYSNKYSKMLSSLNYNENITYWNNNYDLYDDMISELTKDNALIINAVGNIRRRPLDVVCIVVPSDPNLMLNNNEKAFKDKKERYNKLQGNWIVSKVHHFYNPSAQYYRQNLTMFKNYIDN